MRVQASVNIGVAKAAGSAASDAGAAAWRRSRPPRSAQTVPDQQRARRRELDLPAQPARSSARPIPTSASRPRSSTATVITGTDVDQRVALIVAANDGKLDAGGARAAAPAGAAQPDRRDAADPGGQGQRDRDHARTRSTRASPASRSNFKRTPDADARLSARRSARPSARSSARSRASWPGSACSAASVEPFVNVGDEEVKAIIERLEGVARAPRNIRLGEIYLSATPETAGGRCSTTPAADRSSRCSRAAAVRISYARQFSEASTARGRRRSRLGPRWRSCPTQLAPAAQEMQVGQVAGPIEMPGGFSILYLVDKRQVLTADPRDAVLSLKQMSIKLPRRARPRRRRPSRAGRVRQGDCRRSQGCGERRQGRRDGRRRSGRQRRRCAIRDLPPRCRTSMLELQVGQATPPFGSLDGGRARAGAVRPRRSARRRSCPTSDADPGRRSRRRASTSAPSACCATCAATR